MEENEKSNVLKVIGKNIKKIRLLRDHSQESLANALDKSVNFISLLENGKTGLSVQTIVDICKVLKIDVSEIFTGLVPLTEKSVDSFISDSLNLMNEKDKSMVTDLISYIISSKS